MYALGGVLPPLLTAAPPQPGLPPLPLPAPFDAVVPRCLDPRPEARPKATELVAALTPKA